MAGDKETLETRLDSLSVSVEELNQSVAEHRNEFHEAVTEHCAESSREMTASGSKLKGESVGSGDEMMSFIRALSEKINSKLDLIIEDQNALIEELDRRFHEFAEKSSIFKWS